jgi:hypothetical protein
VLYPTELRGHIKPMLANFVLHDRLLVCYHLSRRAVKFRLLARDMNSFRNFPHRDRFWLTIVSAVVISGCTASDAPLNIILHNPKTGTERTCSAKQSSSKDVSILAAAVESCAKQLESHGFVRTGSR